MIARIVNIYRSDGVAEIFWRMFSRLTYSPIYKRVLKKLSPIIIKVAPSSIALFMDGGLKVRRIPLPWERIERGPSVFDDFWIDIPPNCEWSEVNIVFRGSLESDDQIDKALPTFFVNPILEIPSDFQDVWLATSDRLVFAVHQGITSEAYGQKFYAKSPGMKSVFFASNVRHNELWSEKKISELEKSRIVDLVGLDPEQTPVFFVKTRFGLKNIQIGSGILAVLCLLKVSDKVNVFGWDAFISRDFGASYSEQVQHLWYTESWVNEYTRFAATALNWIYATRLYDEFIDTERLVIHGRVTSMFREKWVREKLFRLVYRD